MFESVHIHGQAYWHNDVYIVGNNEGLLKLKEAVDKAILEGMGKVSTFVNDGEGYDIVIKQVDNIEKYAVPYHDECAEEKRCDVLYPWNEIK
jgi:hypothetical protein